MKTVRPNSFRIVDQQGNPVQVNLISSEEWSALYINGELTDVGDTYWVEEQLFSYIGVEEDVDDAFMQGQKDRSGVAQTLDEVQAYRDRVAEADRQAAELRRQADELERQARELRAGAAQTRP